MNRQRQMGWTIARFRSTRCLAASLAASMFLVLCGVGSNCTASGAASEQGLKEVLATAYDEIKWIDVTFQHEVFSKVEAGSVGIPAGQEPDYQREIRWVVDNTAHPREWKLETGQSRVDGLVESLLLHVDGVTYNHSILNKDTGRENRRLTVGPNYNESWVWTADNPYAVLTPLAKRPKGLDEYVLSEPEGQEPGGQLVKVRVGEITSPESEAYWELTIDSVSGAIHQADLLVVRGEEHLLHNRYEVTKWSETQADGRKWPLEILSTNRPNATEGAFGRMRLVVTALSVNQPVLDETFDLQIEPNTLVENSITGESYVAQ